MRRIRNLYLLNSERRSLLWRHNGHDGVSNHQPHDCLLKHSLRSKKTPKPRVTGLCAGNSPVIGEFPAQMSSNEENVSIWWRHHDPTWRQQWMMNCLVGWFAHQRALIFEHGLHIFVLICIRILICRVNMHNDIQIYGFNDDWIFEISDPCNVYIFYDKSKITCELTGVGISSEQVHKALCPRCLSDTVVRLSNTQTHK